MKSNLSAADKGLFLYKYFESKPAKGDILLVLRKMGR
jgi:hypothetical protein